MQGRVGNGGKTNVKTQKWKGERAERGGAGGREASVAERGERPWFSSAPGGSAVGHEESEEVRL